MTAPIQEHRFPLHVIAGCKRCTWHPFVDDEAEVERLAREHAAENVGHIVTVQANRVTNFKAEPT